MAETTVDFLMENLKQLMHHKINLNEDEKDQIESLYVEFGFLRNFLKDCDEKLYEPKQVSNLVKRIRDLANKAEDTIDLFVVNVVLNVKMGHVCDRSLNLGHVKEEIEAIKTELEICEKQSPDMEAVQEEKSSGADVWEEEIVVGFEDEAMQLKEKLTGGQKKLDIISIVGMPGLAFPQDFVIYVRKLTQLWIAEGFIRKIEGRSLEDVAEEYLMDLIGRNLILVSKRRSDGGIKACSIHDLLHNFCCKRAEEEYFLQQILCQDSFSSSLTSKHSSLMRRLCFSSNIFQKTEVIPSASNIRSCLCFVSDYIPFNSLQFLNQCFKLLRVLDMSLIDFTVYPSEIEQLVLLRYLALDFMWTHLAGDVSVRCFPSSISNLWNLETFVLRTSVEYLKLPRSLWKMANLRHLSVSGRGIFVIERPYPNDHISLDNLQTLSCVDPRSCKDILARTPNLKKLDIHGAIIQCLERLMFLDISFLNHLQKLTLCSKLEGFKFINLRRIKFPPNLKQLTLKEAFIKWDEISILGKLLSNLEVLKLSSINWWESDWETNEVFPRLKVLKLEARMLRKWKVSSNHFPSLERLVFSRFDEFEIPSEIGDIPTLHIIEVRQCYPSVVESARRIKEEQTNMGNDWLQIIESKNVDRTHSSNMFRVSSMQTL